MRKGLSPNGSIFNADAAFANGLIDESQRDEMIRRYNKVEKSRTDVALEHIFNLKEHLVGFTSGLMDETKFVNVVNAEAVHFVSSKFGVKLSVDPRDSID